MDEVSEYPKLVVIVPYRDRLQHYNVFSPKIKQILDAHYAPSDYRVLYIHQTDTRDFNRGAMKNIGFLVVRQLYPQHYKNITLLFNDIDTLLASPNLVSFDLSLNTVKHYYGYTHTLGGIVAIRTTDFERINGFPNFWAWGYEDNLLQTRVLAAGMKIDRSTFFAVNDPNVIRMVESNTRIVNRGEYNRFLSRTGEGINSITNLDYTIDDNTGFVNVITFDTNAQVAKNLNKEHNLKDGNYPFGYSKRGAKMPMRF